MIKKEFHPCPCCGNKTITQLGNYEICPICNWEDDPVQSDDPNYSGGANINSLNEEKKLFKRRSCNQLHE